MSDKESTTEEQSTSANTGADSSDAGSSSAEKGSIPKFSDRFHHAINDRTNLVQTAVRKFSGQSKQDPKLQDKLNALQDSHNQIDANNTRQWYKRVLSTPIRDEKLPLGVKIIGILCMVLTFIAGIILTIGVMTEIHGLEDGTLNGAGISTIVVGTIYFVDLFLLDISFLF